MSSPDQRLMVTVGRVGGDIEDLLVTVTDNRETPGNEGGFEPVLLYGAWTATGAERGLVVGDWNETGLSRSLLIGDFNA